MLTPFSHPVYLMVKPAGSHCNLACKYCYYTEKAKLYPQEVRHVMSDELLERFIKQYIEMQTQPYVLFNWHGGETLMRPIAFYRRALELQQKYAGGKHIDNTLQTNATLITPEWAVFFKENNFLIGVSIDGPQEFHDEYRRTRTGSPTFHQVMKGIRLLNKYGVEWNALAVVNDYNADHPLDVYHFFKDIGCRFIQFTPVVERLRRQADGRTLATPLDSATTTLARFSVTPEQWGKFLCTIFDEWVRLDVGDYFIQLFDAALACWVGQPPGLCTLAKTCGHAGALEFNGDVYACDHFVFPKYKLGNLREHTLIEMMYGEAEMKFGTAKRDELTRQCQECEWLFTCHGECPRLRFAFDEYGQPGHPYLCAGYKHFFAHIAPYMDFMKHQLRHEAPPADVMQWIKNGSPAYE